MNEVQSGNMRTPIEIALGIDENGMTTARKLYEFLELNPSNYSKWYKTNITENEFATENEDYFINSSLSTSLTGRGNTKDFKLTAHFAKKLSQKGNGVKGEEAREYFTGLEERTKQKMIDFTRLSPELQRAYAIIESQAIIELEQRHQAEKIKNLEDSVKQIEARISTRNEDYYTISGYASIRGIKVDISKAGILGKKASKLSREYEYPIGKTQDPRFGAVNTYHVDILNEVFKE